MTTQWIRWWKHTAEAQKPSWCTATCRKCGGRSAPSGKQPQPLPPPVPVTPPRSRQHTQLVDAQPAQTSAPPLLITTDPGSHPPTPSTRRLAARLEAQGRVQPEVCVMAGGWKRFRRELEMEDFELVEDFTD